MLVEVVMVLILSLPCDGGVRREGGVGESGDGLDSTVSLFHDGGGRRGGGGGD